MSEQWLTLHGDTVEVFQRRGLTGQRWLWHVTARNGEIVESGEPYRRRIDAVAAAERHHPRVEAE